MNPKHTLMEEDGFTLVAQPGEYWASWVSHTDCPGPELNPGVSDGMLWRWVDMFGDGCKYCPKSPPEGLVGAWKLHNFDNYTKALRIRAGTEIIRV